jgi:hypothetical protein
MNSGAVEKGAGKGARQKSHADHTTSPWRRPAVMTLTADSITLLYMTIRVVSKGARSQLTILGPEVETWSLPRGAGREPVADPLGSSCRLLSQRGLRSR